MESYQLLSKLVVQFWKWHAQASTPPRSSRLGHCMGASIPVPFIGVIGNYFQTRHVRALAHPCTCFLHFCSMRPWSVLGHCMGASFSFLFIAGCEELFKMITCPGLLPSLGPRPQYSCVTFLSTPVECKHARPFGHGWGLGLSPPVRVFSSLVCIAGCEHSSLTCFKESMFRLLDLVGARALALLCQLLVQCSASRDFKICRWWRHSQPFGPRLGRNYPILHILGFSELSLMKDYHTILPWWSLRL